MYRIHFLFNNLDLNCYAMTKVEYLSHDLTKVYFNNGKKKDNYFLCSLLIHFKHGNLLSKTETRKLGKKNISNKV